MTAPDKGSDIARGPAKGPVQRQDAAGPGRRLAGIAARGGTQLARSTLEKRLRIAGYSPSEIRDLLANQGFARSVVLAAAARLATRSVPGALVVSGGLVAKALFDRRRRRRAAARAVEEAGE